MLVVDAWMQHPSSKFLRDDMFASLRRWMGAGAIPEHIPVEFTLGAMDAAGVDIGILSAWHGPQGVMISNDAVAELVRAHPTRFAGVAAVDIRKPMAAVAELERAVLELGLKGLRMLPWLWDLPCDDRRMYPLYAKCCELGVPFCLQVGHTGPLRSSEFGRPIPYLDHVALDFPQLKIVAGHIGYPWTDEMIALADKYENVFIDTSAYKPKRFPPQLVSWARKRGRDKLLFGSNWPMIPPADCLSQVDELGFDDATRSKFLGANAARVFALDGAALEPETRS